MHRMSFTDGELTAAAEALRGALAADLLMSDTRSIARDPLYRIRGSAYGSGSGSRASPLSCMDTSSQRGAAAFARMRERQILQSRVARRLQLVPGGRGLDVGAGARVPIRCASRDAVWMNGDVAAWDGSGARPCWRRRTGTS